MNNRQSADSMCQGIKDEAQKEVDSILKKTEQNAKLRIKLAKGEAKRYFLEKEEQARKDAAAGRQKLLSSVSLQTRKIVGQARGELIELVLDKVKDKGIKFRADKAYLSWLEFVMEEGILNIIGANPGSAEGGRNVRVIVELSSLDMKFITKDFISRVKKEVKNESSKDIEIKIVLQKEKQDTGVWVQSADGRIIFYNTFLDRMERKKEQLKLTIFKEMFKNG